MAPKRQTIDGMSARIRPRTYADIHTPVVRRPIVDIKAPAPVVKTAPSVAEDIQRIAVQRAQAFITTQPPKPASLAPIAVKIAPKPVPTIQSPLQLKVAPKPAASPTSPVVTRPVSLRPQAEEPHPATSITEMLQSIQGTQPVTPATVDSDDIIDLHPNSGFIRTILGRMFENRRSMAITAMSMMLLAGGVVALASSFTTNKIVSEQVQVLTEVASASIDNESLASDEGLPSEDPVPEPVVNAYAPPADEPRYITVPKLRNRKTRVLKMGLDATNSIKTPRTTWDTGWYEGSSKPGDPVGASLIVGHVSGLTTGGVFYNLYRVENGDEIIVEMGDGTKYTYRVVGKEEVPLEGINMNNYLISKDIDKPGLTLMTCAGEYNPVTQTYDNRLAIFAVRDK